MDGLCAGQSRVGGAHFRRAARGFRRICGGGAAGRRPRRRERLCRGAGIPRRGRHTRRDERQFRNGDGLSRIPLRALHRFRRQRHDRDGGRVPRTQRSRAWRQSGGGRPRERGRTRLRDLHRIRRIARRGRGHEILRQGVRRLRQPCRRAGRHLIEQHSLCRRVHSCGGRFQLRLGLYRHQAHHDGLCQTEGFHQRYVARDPHPARGHQGQPRERARIPRRDGGGAVRDALSEPGRSGLYDGHLLGAPQHRARKERGR